MCTVSFVCVDGNAIITHNRDEKVARPAALPPEKYVIGTKNIYFPKDPQAGGTWYAVTETGVVLVLLNGAEEKHVTKKAYNKSRGLIVLDLISSNSPFDAWKTIDLTGIEPFTCVLYQDKNLYQLRWDEVHKTVVLLDTHQCYIWSSATLYPKEVRDRRAFLFENFLQHNAASAASLYEFHRYTKADDPENGLIINRNNEMKTLSITQTVIQDNYVVLSYYNLQRQETFTNTFIPN